MAPITEIDIRAKLREFMKNNFLLGNDANLKDDDSFMNKGIVDSTGILEVVSFVEETFAIKVADEDLLPDNLDSINNLINYVTSRITP